MKPAVKLRSPRRLRDSLRQWAGRRRVKRRRRQEAIALSLLPERLLRDIGLDERASPRAVELPSPKF